MTQMLSLPRPVEMQEGLDLIHRPCCHNDDLSMCGKDISDAEWSLDEDSDRDCIVCEELYAAEMSDPSKLCTCYCCKEADD